MRPRVVTVLGTRPEAIKLAPILQRLQADTDIDSFLVHTGQHREIVDQVLGAFALQPDEDLELLRHGQTLGSLTGRALEGLAPALDRIRPDLLLVQGDTTTTFAAGLAAFYAGVPVAHVEAGLRTFDLANPFPEEANRRLVGVLASLHLAPTPWAKANLVAERVPEHDIIVTGNTIVDALRTLRDRPAVVRSPSLVQALRAAKRGRRLVTVTSHRRENWGEPQRTIAAAIRAAAEEMPDAQFFLPLHPNPLVRDAFEPVLADLPNAVVGEPIPYEEMLVALSRSSLAITDSGGIQEEGCVLGTPVLLLRDVTERPEGVYAGVVRIVGTDGVAILDAVRDVLSNEAVRTAMASASEIFGDGRAAERSHMAIRRFFDLPHDRIDEFAPRELATDERREMII